MCVLYVNVQSVCTNNNGTSTESSVRRLVQQSARQHLLHIDANGAIAAAAAVFLLIRVANELASESAAAASLAPCHRRQ